MHALGMRVLAWLPDGASIHARVFPEIKPKQNSFVWTKTDDGPAIFLYLERQTKANFENTVAHECHHIGLQSLEKEQDAVQGTMSPVVKTAVGWMSAFGEGEAMLAAVGSTDLHPHWEDDALARGRWDGDLMHFNADLATPCNNSSRTFSMTNCKAMTPSANAPPHSGVTFKARGTQSVTKCRFLSRSATAAKRLRNV